MKLLVLAQTPPPTHGQSVMVQALVDGLPPRGIAVRHVNLRLSRSSEDIGRWRVGKVAAALAGAMRAIAARLSDRCDTLYYVPAPPGKRGALYRDWLVLALTRPCFRRTILHWHAVGLGEWVDTAAFPPERWLTQWLLGRVDLAIVLAASVRGDAEWLRPKRTVIVPNGVIDPGESPRPQTPPPFHAVFLGQGSDEKGLFVAAQAVITANQRVRGANAEPAFTLTAAGDFDSTTTAERWRQLSARHPGVLAHIGAVDAAGKRALFSGAHALVLPTRYRAEGLPLVALESLAHDRPVIATAWRGLPEIVTPDVGRLIAAPDAPLLSAALIDLAQNPPAVGACRARYIERYTLAAHLDTLARALTGAAAPISDPVHA